MLLAPILLVIYEFLSIYKDKQKHVQEDSNIQPSCEVIIAGYGRFGQVIGNLLSSQGFQLTLLDYSPSQVKQVRGFGGTVFYGDAARTELLTAAGAENAQVLIVAVNNIEKSLEIIDNAKRHFPHLKILAKAVDRHHAYQLMKRDVEGFRRETFDSALLLGVEALKTLGFQEENASRTGELYREHEQESLNQLAELWGDDKKYGLAV